MTDLSSSSHTSLQQVFEHYIAHSAGGSPHTQRAKQNDIIQFLSFLRAFHGVKNVKDLKVSHWDFSATYQFLEHCLTHHEAPATVGRRLATLKHAGRALAERIPGFINPAREVKPPKVQPLRPKALAQAEIDDIRDRAEEIAKEKTSFRGVRNQMLLELLLETGLRADEVRNLRMSQLDRDLSWIKNVRTKAKQYRNVYITSGFREKLALYLEEREKELKKIFKVIPKKIGDALPLFPGLYRISLDNPESFLMGAKSVWRVIRQLSVNTKLHPHLLRHSFASDLLDSTKDIRLVAQALGHSDVRITMRYTERNQEEVAQALEASRKRTR